MTETILIPHDTKNASVVSAEIFDLLRNAGMLRQTGQSVDSGFARYGYEVEIDGEYLVRCWMRDGSRVTVRPAK